MFRDMAAEQLEAVIDRFEREDHLHGARLAQALHLLL